MNVRTLMTPEPVTIHADASLREALEIMEQKPCRHLPVLNTQQELIGIVSDRDCRLALNSPFILRERWQDEALVDETPVAAVMSRNPITINPDVLASEAVQLMFDNRIGALPVMEQNRLIGILTTTDLLKGFIKLVKE